MKKILTFAIALVMVFALASTALAAGWDITVEEKEVEDIKIEIEALSLKKEAGANLYYEESGYAIIETYPVVLEDKIHAVIAVDIPEKISDDMKDYIANGQLQLVISNSAAEFTACKFNDTNWDSHISADDEIKAIFDSSDIGKTLYFDVFAEVDEAKKDAKIIGTLGVYNEWDGGVFKWEVDGDTYTAYHGNKEFTVKTPDGGKVTFFVEGAAKKADESSKIDVTKAIQVEGKPVSKQVNNTLAFGEPGALITSGDTYDELVEILDEVLDVLGFTYEGVKYMSEEHFVEYFGTIMETEVSKVWPSGYVVDLDTVDPSILPPQTGDNTSVVGFAMIVVALVAAVVLKKVRA